MKVWNTRETALGALNTGSFPLLTAEDSRTLPELRAVQRALVRIFQTKAFSQEKRFPELHKVDDRILNRIAK